jgi:hypothetical protein
MSTVSRAIILFILASALSIAFSAHAAEQVSGKTFYTTTNLWYERLGQIESTNYHRGAILAIGTRVKILEVFDGATTLSDPLGTATFDRFIRFDDESGQSHKLLFIARHAKEGVTVWDLFRQYFSENNPMGEGGAFRSLTAEEQKGVMAGEIAVGMSKTAVVMAYGYPPGHRTPSLKMDNWTYWENRFKTRSVLFSDDKVMADPRKTQPISSIDACIKACKENPKRTPEQCFDTCNH